MSPQLILRIAGIAFLVIAALFALLAVHYYLTQNIRAVMDDLSGKARAIGVAGVRRRASEPGKSATRPGRKATAVTSVHQGEVAEAPMGNGNSPAASPSMPAFDDEDSMSTALVAATVFSGERMNSGTMVFGEAAGAVVPAASQIKEASETPVQVQKGAGVSPALFCLTRSVIMIHSQEVIADSEG